MIDLEDDENDEFIMLMRRSVMTPAELEAQDALEAQLSAQINAAWEVIKAVTDRHGLPPWRSSELVGTLPSTSADYSVLTEALTRWDALNTTLHKVTVCVPGCCT